MQQVCRILVLCERPTLVPQLLVWEALPGPGRTSCLASGRGFVLSHSVGGCWASRSAGGACVRHCVFITYKDFTGHWQQHCAALKWFRGDKENAKDPESSQPFTFPNDEKVELPAIIHPPGMDFTFDESKKVKWSWLEMVAQLDDASMTHVVSGPGNSSRGLVGCDIAPRPGSYDHARSVAQAQHAQGALLKLPLWDFVLRREDGSAIRVHPQWKTPKVGSVPDGHFPDVQPPTAGLGKSDGPGTYKHFKDSASERLLKFRPPVQRQS